MGGAHEGRVLGPAERGARGVSLHRVESTDDRSKRLLLNIMCEFAKEGYFLNSSFRTSAKDSGKDTMIFQYSQPDPDPVFFCVGFHSSDRIWIIDAEADVGEALEDGIKNWWTSGIRDTRTREKHCREIRLKGTPCKLKAGRADHRDRAQLGITDLCPLHPPRHHEDHNQRLRRVPVRVHWLGQHGRQGGRRDARHLLPPRPQDCIAAVLD